MDHQRPAPDPRQTYITDFYQLQLDKYSIIFTPGVLKWFPIFAEVEEDIMAAIDSEHPTAGSNDTT